MNENEKICKELVEQLNKSGVHYILSFQFPDSARLINAGKGALQPALIASAIVDFAERTKNPVKETAEKIAEMAEKMESVFNE